MVAQEEVAPVGGVVAASMTGRDAIAALWDENTRPKLVADTLITLGAEKLLAKVGLNDSVIAGVASMTTISGLKEKKAELTEIAAPYVEKAYTKDGRKEIIDELAATPLALSVKAKAEEKLEAGKAYAAPYIASVKETSAPYVAKLDEIRRSERVEAMVAAFQEAREHPTEKVAELRSAAVDLIKYENIKAYREHVMSAEFQADTARLVQVDLPELAKKGTETVKAKALALSTEIDEYKTMAMALAMSKYELSMEKVAELKEKVPTKEELKEKYDAKMAELKENMPTKEELKAKVAELKEKVPTKEEIKAKVAELKEKVPTKEELKEMYEAKFAELKEKVPTKEELEAMRVALKEKCTALAVELQAELAAELKSGVEQYKTEGLSMADTLERMKRVMAVVDKLLVSPIKSLVKPEETEAEEASDGASATPPEAELSIKALDGESVAASLVIKGFETKADTRPLPPTGSVTDEDEPMEDALE